MWITSNKKLTRIGRLWINSYLSCASRQSLSLSPNVQRPQSRSAPGLSIGVEH